MKQQFETFNFRPATLTRIEQANTILDEYAAQGFALTVRQLFYQLVARGLIPNTMRSYKQTVSLLTKARLAGMVDWEALEDRARQVIYPGHWSDPASIVNTAYHSFRIDRWENQDNHVEIMIEKDALAGVLQPICRQLDVRLIPNRGYSSASTMYRHGQRLGWKEKSLHVLYLGDFDPSGLDMDRDILERLSMFSGYQTVNFQRLALTMPQIEEHNPPPNPAKMTDSRAWAYVSEHGDESWELDALDPTTLRDLVESFVTDLRDEDVHEETMATENAMKGQLHKFVLDYQRQEESTFPFCETCEDQGVSTDLRDDGLLHLGFEGEHEITLVLTCTVCDNEYELDLDGRHLRKV